MKILFTGGTGFIGKNVIPLLKQEIFAPTRAELDLLDFEKTKKYLQKNNFDCIIHCANPTGQNPVDEIPEIFERSLRVFVSIYNCEGLYGKLIWTGSGAEYGKHRDLHLVNENEIGKELPRDSYGLSRFIMNSLKRPDVVNLRLFGCFGKFDPPQKFITHCLDCIAADTPITIRQDCFFDYLYVKDLVKVFTYFTENATKYDNYNITTALPIKLSEIAKICLKFKNSSLPINILKEGFNFEYTASNQRLKNEFTDFSPTSLEDALYDMEKT